MTDFGSRISIEEAIVLCGRLVEMVAADARGGFKSADFGDVTPLLESGILERVSQSNDGLVLSAEGKDMLVALVLRGAELVQPEKVLRYHEKKHSLIWRNEIIRCWGRAAWRQELLVLAFEKAGWTEHIGNPFVEECPEEAAAVLGQTAKNLNKTLPPGTISFHPDGHGGVHWQKENKNGAITPDLPLDKESGS